MSELEVLAGIAKNLKEKKIFDLNISVDVFNETHQAIKCRSNLYKNSETGIVKIACESNINTRDIKCTRKMENETNLKGICEKYGCLKTGDFNILAVVQNFVDLSIVLSLFNSMDLIENEDKSSIITINLQEVAKELIEDNFECFNEGANALLVSLFKIIIKDIESDKYDNIVLNGHVNQNNELTKLEVIGDGKHKINALITAK